MSEHFHGFSKVQLEDLLDCSSLPTEEALRVREIQESQDRPSQEDLEFIQELWERHF